MPADLDILLSTPLFISKKIMRAVFRRHAGKLRGRCLDAGCGRRSYSRFLGGVTGYVGLEYDRSLRPDVRGDAQRLPFAAASFDCAMCQEVLEHVPEPHRVMAELHRVLRPGGYLYLTAPMSWNLHYEPWDFWRFTRYGLAYLAESHGFEIEAIEKLGGFWALWGSRLADNLSRRVKRWTRWLPRAASHGLVLLSSLPISLVFYLLAVLFDRFEPSEAKGWMLLCRRPDDDA